MSTNKKSESQNIDIIKSIIPTFIPKVFISSEPEVTNITPIATDEMSLLKLVETIGRVCYKSKNENNDFEVTKKFINTLYKNGHWSIFRHIDYSTLVDANTITQVKCMLADLGFMSYCNMNYIKYNMYRIDLNFNVVFMLAHMFNRCPNMDTIKWYASILPEYCHSNVKSPTVVNLLFEKFAEHSQITYNLLDLTNFPIISNMLFGGMDVLNRNTSISTVRSSIEYNSTLKPKRYVFKVITDRAISQEIVRHQTLSFTQESTRYVDYTKNPMEFILPDDVRKDNKFVLDSYFNNVYTLYKYLRDSGFTAQYARNILPLCLKTTLYMSGYRGNGITGFSHFVVMRSAKNAHPQIQPISNYIDSVVHCTVK